MTRHLNLISTTGLESEKLVRDYLSSHNSGVLGTVDSAGNPYTAVMYYSLEDDLCLTFATKTETQKAKNILENQRVAMTIYDEVEQSTVQITGTVELIEDENEKRQAINEMYKKSAAVSKREFPPIDKLVAGDYVVYRLLPLVIRLGVFARPVSSEEEYYETLVFSTFINLSVASVV